MVVKSIKFGASPDSSGRPPPRASGTHHLVEASLASKMRERGSNVFGALWNVTGPNTNQRAHIGCGNAS